MAVQVFLRSWWNCGSPHKHHTTIKSHKYHTTIARIQLLRFQWVQRGIYLLLECCFDLSMWILCSSTAKMSSIRFNSLATKPVGVLTIRKWRGVSERASGESSWSASPATRETCENKCNGKHGLSEFVQRKGKQFTKLQKGCRVCWFLEAFETSVA